MRRTCLVLLLGALLLFTTPAGAETVQVGMIEDKANDRWGFNPGDLTVSVGDTVTFLNDGTEIHTIEALDGQFNSGSVDVGQSFAYTFTARGEVGYVCSLHPFMEGVVRVR